jgi:hypothetical protein
MREEREIYREVLAMLGHTKLGSAWLEISAQFDELDVYLAGGGLRNILVKRDVDPKDFDFFLGGSGIEKVLARLADTGTIRYGPFGSPRWFPADPSSVYCDVIPIRNFFNGLWRCEDILDVLNQFDFTANAVAVHLRTGVLHDPQNGRRDLTLQLMRAIRFDYPDEPISASNRLTRPAVVWFRILHYAAILGFTIEPVTHEWICRHSGFAEQLDDFVATFFPLHPAALAAVRRAC